MLGGGKAKADGSIVIGASKGAELALLLASRHQALITRHALNTMYTRLLP
jgi:hypothetical protein